MGRVNMGPQLALCVLFSYVLAGAAKANINNINPVPVGWEGMCTYGTDSQIVKLYTDTEGHVIRLQCHVTGNAEIMWRFQTLRDWLRGIPGISVFVEVTCSNGGQISLPWPMKANGVVGVVVSGCILREKYADFGNPDVSQIPDQLRVLEIRNSMWLNDGSGYDRIRSPGGLANLTSDYDCGQDSTIEYLMTNNISDVIELNHVDTTPSAKRMQFRGGFQLDLNGILGGKSSSISDSSETETHLQDPYQLNGWLDMDWDINDREDSVPALVELYNLNIPDRRLIPEGNITKSANDAFNQLLQNLLSLDVKCNYEKLRILDESNPRLLPIDHFTLLVQGARYPELRIMNYSRAGIRQMPQELQDFRMYFPKLQYLDLSRNLLTKIPLISRFREASGDSFTLDVRRNLITSISVDDLLLWAQNMDVFVDIRDNPFHCDCQMMHFLQRIKSESFFASNLRRYRYILDLQCASPSHLKGQKLSDVNLRCAATTNLAAVSVTSRSSADISTTTNAIIAGSVSGMVVISFVALLVFIIVHIRAGKAMSKKHTETNIPRMLSYTPGEGCFINIEDLCIKL